MRLLILVLSLVLSSHIVAMGSDWETCQGCHVERAVAAKDLVWSKGSQLDQNFACKSCHVDIIEKRGSTGTDRYIHSKFSASMAKKMTYLAAQPLHLETVTKSGRSIKKYRKDGFLTFLQNPRSRFPGIANNSMFAIDRTKGKALVAAKSEYFSDDPFEINAAAKALGASLFRANCETCHSGSSAAPLLRIGLPFLSSEYVNSVLTGEIEKAGMPVFSKFSEDEKTALFHYISDSTTDIKISSQLQARSQTKFHLPGEIYSDVIVPMLGRSCRHCHTSDLESQDKVSSFFGSKSISFLLKRTSVGFEPLGSSSEKLILPRANCEDSMLIERLEARGQEWKGNYSDSNVGMPLTMPPESEETIKKIRLWQKAGCPKDGKKLCETCQT